MLFCISDMRSYDCLMAMHAHDGEVCCVQFSVDETTIYSMGLDGKVQNEWISEWNEWMKKKQVNVQLNNLNEWMNEWMNEWRNKCASEPMN